MRYFSVFVLFFFIATFIVAAPNRENRYFVLIGNDSSTYTNDNLPYISGSDINGRVAIRLNENPIGFYSSGTGVFDINSWLSKKDNTLHFTGVCKNTIYVKVIVVNDNEITVIIKQEILPIAISQGFSIAFKTPFRYRLPIYERHSGFDAENQVEKDSITAQVKKIHRLLAEKKYRIAATEITTGYSLWMSGSYSLPRHHLRAMMGRFLDEWATADFVPRTIGWENLRYEWGSEIVMVYSDFERGTPNKPFLFPMYSPSWGVMNFPALFFAKIKGKWMVWKCYF